MKYRISSITSDTMILEDNDQLDEWGGSTYMTLSGYWRGVFKVGDWVSVAVRLESPPTPEERKAWQAARAAKVRQAQEDHARQWRQGIQNNQIPR